MQQLFLIKKFVSKCFLKNTSIIKAIVKRILKISKFPWDYYVGPRRRQMKLKIVSFGIYYFQYDYIHWNSFICTCPTLNSFPYRTSYYETVNSKRKKKTLRTKSKKGIGKEKLPKVEHTAEDSSTKTATLTKLSSNTIPSTTTIRLEIRRAATV